MRRLVLSAAISLAVFACTGEASERCRTSCERADECAKEVRDDPNFKFDKGECAAACSFLEKDSKGAELVANHAECIANAKTCPQVIACD